MSFCTISKKNSKCNFFLIKSNTEVSKFIEKEQEKIVIEKIEKISQDQSLVFDMSDAKPLARLKIQMRYPDLGRIGEIVSYKVRVESLEHGREKHYILKLQLNPEDQLVLRKLGKSSYSLLLGEEVTEKEVEFRFLLLGSGVVSNPSIQLYDNHGKIF